MPFRIAVAELARSTVLAVDERLDSERVIRPDANAAEPQRQDVGALAEPVEREGKLKPGGTIVEPTSGNTGTGLAIVAALKGYRCIFTMPDKMSREKISLLKAFGAEVIICPYAVEPESPESYYSVSDRLAEEIPGAYKPDQYRNEGNPRSHYETTGPEIWEQTEGKVTHFVAGVGTGGTITADTRSLYRALRRLADVGLVQDVERPAERTGADRKYFSLTESGERVLNVFLERNVRTVYLDRNADLFGRTGTDAKSLGNDLIGNVKEESRDVKKDRRRKA